MCQNWPGSRPASPTKSSSWTIIRPTVPPDFLAQLSGDIQIIRNSDNFGFAKACNQGARAARGRFLIFLNNDTIPLSDWLTALVAEVTSHPDVGIVGSKLLYEDDTIQHAGVVFSRAALMPYHLYRRVHRDHPAVNQRRTFQSVTAACMLIRREIFEAEGGFDEEFQNGFEDVDLCLKVGDKGWQIVYQPLSVLYHLESQTPGRKAHDQDNALRFLGRWGQRWWLADEDLYYFEDGYLASPHEGSGQGATRTPPCSSRSGEGFVEARGRHRTCGPSSRHPSGGVSSGPMG